MRLKPAYFDEIRIESIQDWQKLEHSSWNSAVQLLFSEVQSPQHVISELLQNADDAGATWARIAIDGQTFVFEHDGLDFTEPQLKSLCSFANSSKARLHTIGFRGIGFKSTFSFGPLVEVITPSLAMVFNKDQFTVPNWLDNARPTDRTTIRIALANNSLRERAEAEINAWFTRPTPLLFFQNLQTLDLQGRIVRKTIVERGPFPNSRWVRLTGSSNRLMLHITSEEEPFPPDALSEIETERRASAQELNIRGCRIDIILYDVGDPTLYVVLPTNVEPTLSFSCNAPFLQDPGRKGIKDPVQSPTNRWLLIRIGKLAAAALLEWLQNSRLPIHERVKAYDLLSTASLRGTSVSSEVTATVMTAFSSCVSSDAIIFTSEETLEKPGKTLGLPPSLVDVWNKQTLLAMFGPSFNHILSPAVSAVARKRLRDWKLIETMSAGEAAERLAHYKRQVPNTGLDKVLTLWSFLETAIDEWQYYQRKLAHSLPIVPVDGTSNLARPDDVVSLGPQMRTAPSEMTQVLLRFVLVVDRSWMNLLDTANDSPDVDTRIHKARSLRSRIDLPRPASIADLFMHAEKQVFALQDPGLDGVEIVRLAALAGITAGDGYRYKCRDGRWRNSNDGLLLAPAGAINQLLPVDWKKSHVLHDDYEANLTTIQRNDWREWARTKTGISEFPLPRKHSKLHSGRWWLERFCQERGGDGTVELPYKREYFICEDIDFDEDLWNHWQKLASTDATLWSEIIRGMLETGVHPTTHARVYQQPTNKLHPINHGPLLAKWVIAFQSLPCLVDTFGRPATPTELLRVTPHNAFLQDIERFLHPDLDKAENVWLLDLLGVRVDPTTTDVPMRRLRALASASKPHIGALVPLYKTLDRLSANFDSDRLQELREVFEGERIILAHNETWHTSSAVVQNDDAGLPGVLTIHPEIRSLELPLWDRLGVRKRANLDSVLDWLRHLPRNERFDERTASLVQEVLSAYPFQVWNRCASWMDVTGRWVEVDDLRWWTTEVRTARRLFPNVRQATADLTMLPLGFDARALCTGLTDLAMCLNFRVRSQTHAYDIKQPDWFEALARGLLRLKPKEVKGEDENAPEHPDVSLARRMLRSVWQFSDAILVIPYIGDDPAGPETIRKAIWIEDEIDIAGRSTDHYDELVEVLSGQCTDPSVRHAVVAGIERSPSWIRDYLEAHFDLF